MPAKASGQTQNAVEGTLRATTVSAVFSSSRDVALGQFPPKHVFVNSPFVVDHRGHRFVPIAVNQVSKRFAATLFKELYAVPLRKSLG